MTSKNILILAPFVIVKEFYYPLVAIAKVLKRLNYKIFFVHCKQAMSEDCTAMLAHGLGQNSSETQKKELCNKCFNFAKIAEKINPWESLWLQNINFQDRNQKLELSKKEIRKFAGYELILTNKNSYSSKNVSFMQKWSARYAYLLRIAPQARSILEMVNPKIIICYNSLYGIHRLFFQLAAKRNIQCFCLHESFNMGLNNEFVLFKNNFMKFLKRIQNKSLQIKFPLTKKINFKIKSHLDGLFKARKPWAYSAPKSSVSKKHYHKSFCKKVLVALSSPDELVGLNLLGLLPKSDSAVFSNQIQWISWIFKIAKKYPTTLFFIRPHPRFYPNKRESAFSDFAFRLEKIKKRINLNNIFWPEQENQGSIWDHLESTDILFNAWSSVGDIFAMYGIPVFTFFPHFANSGCHLGICETTACKYEKQFRKHLSNPRPFVFKRQAKKWLASYLGSNTFNLSWAPSFWNLSFRILIPKRWHPLYDTVTFCHSKVVAHTQKIKNLLELSSPHQMSLTREK